MAAKRSAEKPAEIVPLRGGKNKYLKVIRYGSSFKCAYALLSLEDGTGGPAVFSMFGFDSFYLKRLDFCWKAFLKEDPSRSESMDETDPPEEWSLDWLARSFVRWLNAGGEARVRRARAARRGHA